MLFNILTLAIKQPDYYYYSMTLDIVVAAANCVRYVNINDCPT